MAGFWSNAMVSNNKLESGEGGTAAGLELAIFRMRSKRIKIKREIKERMAPYGPSCGGKERSRKGCRPVAGNFQGAVEEEGFAGE